MTLIGLPAIIEELLFSALMTFVISLFYRFLINQNELRELKSKMKEKQAKIKELQKTNPQEANKMLNEVTVMSGKQLRFTTKPMLLTLVLVGIVLPYFSQVYQGIMIQVPFSTFFQTYLGWLVGSGGLVKPWLAWYMLVSIPLGQLFRKLIGAEL